MRRPRAEQHVWRAALYYNRTFRRKVPTTDHEYIDGHRWKKQPSLLEQMRREIIKYIGSNIVLVLFQVGWELTALKLPVRAERIVDLSVKPAFATFTYNFARSAPLTPNKKSSSSSRHIRLHWIVACLLCSLKTDLNSDTI